MIGNLYDFEIEKDSVEYEDLPNIDKYILGKLSVLMKEVSKCKYRKRKKKSREDISKREEKQEEKKEKSRRNTNKT